MVLIPVLGEAFLELVGGGFAASSSAGELQLLLGFISAFLSGLFACKVMIAIVQKARLKWFALYCAIVGIACVVSNLF
jgi:undecaprenyl-diphosphatase